MEDEEENEESQKTKDSDHLKQPNIKIEELDNFDEVVALMESDDKEASISAKKLVEKHF